MSEEARWKAVADELAHEINVLVTRCANLAGDLGAANHRIAELEKSALPDA